jgi:hypothetical protein
MNSTSNRTRSTLVALATAGILGCGEAPVDEVANVQTPVIGGANTTAHPEAGLFFAPAVQGGFHGCTATLVGSREILTASHCIADQSSPSGSGWSVSNFQLRSPSNTTFQIDSSTSCSSGCPAGFFCDSANGVCAEQFFVERIFPQGLQPGGNDLSIGKLTATVPSSLANPAQIMTSEPSNTNLTLVGYGCVSNGGGDFGIKRFKTYFYNGGNSFNYCSGDSGGPTFFGGLLDGGPIVRVTSATSSSGADMGADPIAYRSQILGMVNAMEAGGISYRGQVQGIGFQPAVTNGAVAGTTGQSLRLEGLQIWSETPGVLPAYRAYVQNVGWQGEFSDGNLAGTVGQSLRWRLSRSAWPSAARFRGCNIGPTFRTPAGSPSSMTA